MTAPESSLARQAIQLVLPREHGSWSLALEPVAFGLLAAPSAAGGALAAAAGAGFFLRRPLKIFLAPKPDPRRALAGVCILVLSLLALAGLLLAAKFGAVENLWPLLPAALAGAVFVWCDSRNEAREGAAEVAGAVTFGFLPAAFGALVGWNVPASLALAALALVRGVPTVLCVRAFLRFNKGQRISIFPALAASAAGLALVVWLAYARLAPWLAAGFALVLALRSAWLLGARPSLTPRRVGVIEAVLGGIMVLALASAWGGGLR